MFRPRFNRTPHRVEGNRIDIDAPKLKRARLHLNDRIVDLDQPVTVTLNGDEIFSGDVERSAAFLLDWFEKHGDAKRLFWNQLEIAASG